MLQPKVTPMIVRDSVYGEIEFQGAIAKIINSQPLQRLKRIHQNGAMFLAYPHISTSRFEHSLGVCYLIRILGGSIEEQIAGLLHDISHTAFSHVIDYVLDNRDEDFHEHHKLHFLSDRQIVKTLHSLKLQPENFIDDRQFSLLETELPKLCADRLDYALRDLIAWNKISQPEAQLFLDSLKVVNGTIAINSIEQAYWFKNNYQYLNRHFFGDAKNIMANSAFSKLLQAALKAEVLQIEDFFQDDNFVIDKINEDRTFKERLQAIGIGLKNLKEGEDENTISQFKPREVDPPVIEAGNVIPLSAFV